MLQEYRLVGMVLSHT